MNMQIIFVIQPISCLVNKISHFPRIKDNVFKNVSFCPVNSQIFKLQYKIEKNTLEKLEQANVLAIN